MVVWATVGAALLCAYSVGILYALLAPPREPDPQRGVAIGCLSLVLVALVVTGLVLAAAVAFHFPMLVRAITLLCAYPAVMLVLRSAWLVYCRMRERMGERRRSS